MLFIGSITLDYGTSNDAESDLKTVNGIIEHFHLHNGYDCDLFVRDTRPACIRNLYDSANLNPEITIRKLDHVRQDGKTARGLFFLSPVFTKEDYPQRDPHIDLEELKPPKHKFHKVTRKLLRLRNNRPKSMEVMDALDYQPLTDEIPLPTPEEALRRMCKSQPSLCIVEVDTAGTSFNRMCAFRQSLHHIDFESLDTEATVEQFDPDVKPMEQKRKRRQTLTGIPGHIAKELSLFRTKNHEKLRNNARDRPKTTDFETHRHLHQSPWIFLEAETAEFVGAVDRRFRLRRHDNALYASIRRCNSLPRMSRKKAVAPEEKPPYKVAMPLVRTLSDSRLNVKKTKAEHSSFSSLTRSVSFAGRGKAWLASSRVRPKSEEVLDELDPIRSPEPSDLNMRTMSSVGSGSKSTEDLKCSLQSLAAVYSRRGYPMPPAESLASVQLRENRNKKNKEDRQSSS
ncbi:uncharacterized protein LOC106171373, partial [Lingula anatina]|uniref:Uncharacterized protein LOC106171373 n=1 Tax=Lingula anatina TaxID=7574 RepID=A0A2R2MLG2_LINAN